MRSLKAGEALVEVWPDAGSLTTRAAELFTETARLCVTERDSFSVALSGGSTPRALYGLLAGEAYAPLTPWDKTHVFWSDERPVPPSSAESNYRTAFDALLSRVPVPPGQIHRMRAESEPEQAARDYSQLLREKLDGNPPRFDLMLLGMGEDGHTASLFPHSGALLDTEHRVAAPFVEKLGSHRLTLTLPVINAAARIIFMVTGAKKAETLRVVLEEEGRGLEYPAQLVSPSRGELLWLVDEAVAERLSPREKS